MNIHEYQAKELLAAFSVPIAAGRMVTDLAQVDEALSALPAKAWVVKAQVHAGGRGKAGGVRLCHSHAEVHQAVDDLLGMRLITKQTGLEGKLVSRVYLEQAAAIAKEYYLAFLIDRENEGIAMVASRDGGMDIEQVAEEHPESIVSLCLDPTIGVSVDDARCIAQALSVPKDGFDALYRLLLQLYEAFVASDASMIELNPLAVLEDGELLAVDAKVIIDDNALYRQKELAAMRDSAEEDPKEVAAHAFDLNYIALDGNIACMVNGAGLAMATMDIIQLKGGSPANFLDVGGGVSQQVVSEAFRLLLSDTHVKAVLVNIFGGIVRCDVIAKGILQAVQGRALSVPIILRLVGTHEEEGRRLIRESALNVQWAADLDEAACLAIGAIS